MYRDNANQLDAIVTGASSATVPCEFLAYAGEIFWTLTEADGSIVSEGHRKNVVTKDAGILLAALMKNKSAVDAGIQYLAVGTGKLGWDPMSPPPASNIQRSLWNELGRKAFTSATFKLSNGTTAGYPTNIVDFSFSFGGSEVVGPIVEMGLIGGWADPDANVRNPIPNATPYDPTVDVDGKDILCNYVTFPVINKAPGQTLSYTWRLTF